MKINFLKPVMLFVAALFLSFASISVSAQDVAEPLPPKKMKVDRQQMSPEEKAAKQTERMTKQLDLSPEQAAAISDIHLKYNLELDALRAEQTENREQKRAAVKNLRQQQKAEINGILTPEQITKMEELIAKRKAKRKGRRARGRMGGRTAPSNN